MSRLTAGLTGTVVANGGIIYAGLLRQGKHLRQGTAGNPITSTVDIKIIGQSGLSVTPVFMIL